MSLLYELCWVSLYALTALNAAMIASYKLKNFIHAAEFAQRILELPESGNARNKARRAKVGCADSLYPHSLVYDVSLQAAKVLKLSTRQGRNACRINYDEKKPFVLCCASLSPIYRGSAFLRCPYCASTYEPEHKEAVCSTCELSVVGLETMGLVSPVDASK